MKNDELKNIEDYFSKLIDDKISVLKDAYEKLQTQFKEINFELDKKNKALEDSLLENRNISIKLNNILENISNGVISIDSNGIITHINSQIEILLNTSKEKIVGKNYDEIFSDISEENRLTNVLLNENAKFEGEKKILINSKNVYLWFHCSKLHDSNGVLIGAIETMTDITKLKTMEADLQHKSTLAALGEMAATVAHEIRNPLGAVGGYVALLDRLSKTDKEKNIISKIKRAINTLSKTVNNLLGYTRKIVIRRSNVKLSEFFDEIEKNIKFEIDKSEKNIRFNIISDFKNDFFKFDREKIYQILLNLILNSIQAIICDGKIILEITRDSEDYIVFSVIDSEGLLGNAKDVFNPFYTTKENGTGLGLAISKKIAQMHSGFLECSVDPNKFTRFDLKIK